MTAPTPMLKDSADQTEVRKALTDVSTALTVAQTNITGLISQTASLQSQVTNSQNQINSLPIADFRNTTGGTRTETVIPLNVNQTAIINWQINNTSGGAAAITFSTPVATGTYAVSLMNIEGSGGAGFTPNTLANTGSGSLAEILSAGVVAQGQTISLNSALPASKGMAIVGTVTRVS